MELPHQNTSDNPMVLWYEEPATQWSEALPLGNGRLGGMVFGGVRDELIQLNEDTLWSGYPKDTNNREAGKYLEEIRNFVDAGQYVEAEKIIETHVLDRTRAAYYQAMADLYINFSGLDDFSNYRRELNLETATCTSRFESEGRLFTRKTFISQPDQVLVVRLSCSQQDQISCVISMTSKLPNKVEITSNQLVLKGKSPSEVVQSSGITSDPTVKFGDQGISFEVHLKTQIEGGHLLVNANNELVIEKADAVTIYLTAATNFKGFDKQPLDEKDKIKLQFESWLTVASSYTFEELQSRHLEEYQKYFKRLDLNLGTNENVKLPLNKRLEKIRTGQGNDPQLAALYFQYGRYLLIASSRPGTQPANLQGIWNDKVIPPWGSNYTTNINVEMNYWPVETCNLSECHIPLFNMINELRINGRTTAEVYYNCRGWAAHHNADLWRKSTPSAHLAKWGFWPLAGAWLCQHLWEHFAFNQGRSFLETSAYSIMKEAALFCLDWLVEDGQGNLVTNPSTSPENSFFTASREPCAVSAGSTLDMSLIRDLFNHCIEASLILETDEKFRTELQTAMVKLKPFQIGRFGQLQEWSEDFDEPEPGHRHVSHLFGLYPGNQITPITTPDLAEACRKSLERRRENGGGQTGWSSAWFINLWARLGMAEDAYKHLTILLEQHTYPNLFDSHPVSNGASVFQIDGNFGGTAGIAEMLLQSHSDELQLLPTLPKAWPNGYVKGLKARGGFEIDIIWENGLLQEAQIKSNFDNTCRIRTPDPIKDIVSGTEQVEVDKIGDNVVELQSKAGKTYLIRG